MRVKIIKIIGIITALSISLPIATAQRSSGLNFISELEDYRTIRRMLPDYLSRLVGERLTERKQAIARLTTAANIGRRRAEVRAKILESIGGLPEKSPLNARVVGSLERDDYRIEKIIFESQPGFFVTANLYLPKRGAGPYPGILFQLGHERSPRSSQESQQILAEFARRGFVALTWDPVGHGERIQIYDSDLGDSKVLRSPTEHAVVGIQCSVVGDNLARYMIHDGLRALDYLVSRSEVDASRIGCTGNSGGGNMTAYLAALDDRITVAAPSCWITSWDWLFKTIGPQDSEQTLFPFIAEGLDYPDFIYAAAPKPYLILAATRDFFSINGTRESYAEAKTLYERLGAPEKLAMFEADDHHAYSQPRRMAAYRWFGRWLKEVEDQAPETRIDFATEEELRCVQTGQVTTSLDSETVFSLNQKRAEQLRLPAPALKHRDHLPAFRAEIRNRVKQTLNLTAEKNPPSVKRYGRIEGAGYHIEKLVYESEPGIAIPSLLYLPDSGAARRPAIVYVHGRGKTAGAAELEALVQAGFVALSIDLRGAGETMVIESQQSNDTRPYFGDFDSAMIALLLNKPLVGMRAVDISRGVDLLLAREEVDRDKIYGFGKGDGGPPLLFAAVLDERIKKVALEETLVSYRSIITHRIHRQVFEHVVNGALKFYDFPDLAAALAPRSIWIVNSVDPVGRRVDLAEMKRAYGGSTTAFRLLENEGAIRVEVRKNHEGVAAFYRDWLN